MLKNLYYRYGLMLVLITNLSIWMAAVTDESVHQTKDLEDDLKVLTSTNGYHEAKGMKQLIWRNLLQKLFPSFNCPVILL